MEKKEKLFYLNFIRAISMIIIVTYHFFVHFAENNIVGTSIINDKWGKIGVALFFMISGAALMYNYNEKLDIKKYAKKRIIGIYPMFWIAYILAYIFIFCTTKSCNIWGLPFWKIIFSVFGMDGYLGYYTPTMYILGEWFLGCIIIIYILFPILRILVNKYPKITIIVATIIYLLTFIFYNSNLKMPLDKTIIVSCYAFLLGMYAIKLPKIKLWQMIIALAIAGVGYFINVENENLKIFICKTTAYFMFFVFAYIGQQISIDIIKIIINKISKYSYAIFLTHHFLIIKIENFFQNQTYGIIGTILLYITCWIAIIIATKVIYKINKSILDLLTQDKQNLLTN